MIRLNAGTDNRRATMDAIHPTLFCKLNWIGKDMSIKDSIFRMV